MHFTRQLRYQCPDSIFKTFFISYVVCLNYKLVMKPRFEAGMVDKRVVNVLLNGFGVMMAYAGMLGGAILMVGKY